MQIITPKPCLSLLIILFTTFGCSPTKLVTYQSVAIISTTQDLLWMKGDPPEISYPPVFINQFTSHKIKSRTLDRLETTHPELIASSPKIMNFTVVHRKRVFISKEGFYIKAPTVFDIAVESDNPEYAQLYLQTHIDEYFKWKREFRAGVSNNALAAIETDLSRQKIEIRSKEDKIEQFLAENKKDLDKSKQAEHELHKRNLARSKERHKRILTNYEALQIYLQLAKRDIVSISQPASPAAKRKSDFFDDLF